MPLVEPSLPVIFVHTHTVHVGLPFFCFCSAPLICLPASSSPCRVAIECLAATINHIAGTERAIRPWPCPTLTACRDARGLAQPAGPRHKGRARRRVVSLLSTTFFPLSLWLAGSGATRRPTWALDSDATIRHPRRLAAARPFFGAVGDGLLCASGIFSAVAVFSVARGLRSEYWASTAAGTPVVVVVDHCREGAMRCSSYQTIYTVLLRACMQLRAHARCLVLSCRGEGPQNPNWL